MSNLGRTAAPVPYRPGLVLSRLGLARANENARAFYSINLNYVAQFGLSIFPGHALHEKT